MWLLLIHNYDDHDDDGDDAIDNDNDDKWKKRISNLFSRRVQRVGWRFNNFRPNHERW